MGPRIIPWLAARFHEPLKGDSPHLSELQRAKSATPTLGGLMLLAGMLGGVLVWGDLGNRYLQAALGLVVGLALLGLADDLAKVFTTAGGLSARWKLLGQISVALGPAIWVWQQHAACGGALALHAPWCRQWCVELGPGFVPLAVLVIVGTSNAVNLSDGLDGLAAGCAACALAAMGAAAYAASRIRWAGALGLTAIPGAGGMTVATAGMLGGLVAFLRFNRHPAQVFMGDTGSLPLGGLLGFLAVVARQEWLLVLVGGVFVAEAASVLVQVGYFRWRRKRVFRCAPLHHHFQFQGWPEPTIVARFWIAAAICALAGLAVL